MEEGHRFQLLIIVDAYFIFPNVPIIELFAEASHLWTVEANGTFNFDMFWLSMDEQCSTYINMKIEWFRSYSRE